MKGSEGPNAPPVTATATTERRFVVIEIPATSQNQHSKTYYDEDCCNSCCALLLVALFFLLIPLMVVSNIQQIRKENYYQSPEFQVGCTFSYPNQTDYNSSSREATWEIDMLVKNPNKIAELSYTDIQLLVYGGDNRFLAGGSVPAFHQGATNLTLLHATLSQTVPRAAALVPFKLELHSMVTSTAPSHAVQDVRIRCEDFGISILPNETTSYGGHRVSIESIKNCTRLY